MSTKSVKKPTPSPIRKTAPGTKPAAQAAATFTAPAVEKPKRKPVILKPPMERAMKRAKLLDKNSRAMLKLVSNWQGEATDDQRSTNSEIVAGLTHVVGLAKQILIDTDMLRASGFAPTGGRGGVSKEPLAAGTLVQIKAKHFEPEVYGEINDFEVVVDNGKQVRIRTRGDLKSPQMIVSRTWLTAIGAAADADDGVDDAPEDGDTK